MDSEATDFDAKDDQIDALFSTQDSVMFLDEILASMVRLLIVISETICFKLSDHMV